MHYNKVIKSKDEFSQAALDYIKSGISENRQIGTEFEFFFKDQNTATALSLFERLGSTHPDWINEDFRLNSEDFTISLEPAGQLEISLKPMNNISNIREQLNVAVSEVSKLLKRGQNLVGVGYYPYGLALSQPIIPKSRYEYMDNYFGRYGRCMMRGTASMQVSIDYSSLEDLDKKRTVFNFISEALYNMFDSAYYFEGRTVNSGVRRQVWKCTDVIRAKNMNLFDSHIDYIEHLLSVPPICMKREDGTLYPTGDRTLGELIEDGGLYVDIEHVFSMVFPNVRIKKYLEVRCADSLGEEFAILPAVIISHIAYVDELLEKYYRMHLEVGDLLKKKMPKTTQFKSELVFIIIDDVIENIKNSDPLGARAELENLENFKKILIKYNTVANYYKDAPNRAYYKGSYEN